MYIYVCLFILILYLKSMFWNRQPISHVYGFKQGALSNNPLFNKYCDLFHVQDSTIQELFPYLKTVYSGFLKESHLDYVNDSFISLYKNPDVQGCIVSRKVNLLYHGKKSARFHEYHYGKTETIKKILLQTHEYKNKNISIFALDYRLPFVIPVTRIPIEWVKTNTFRNYTLPKGSLVRATKDMLLPLYELKSPFLCKMTPPLDVLETMMDSKIFSIFYHYHQSTLVAIFLFKNTLLLEKNESVLDWIGTIHVAPKPIGEVISTLLHLFRKTYPIVRIHQLSHTPPYTGYKKTFLNYYIYNYGIKRISPKDCLFV